jgi:hypothetical protein
VIWFDLRDDVDQRGVSVTFRRRDDSARRIGARISAPPDPDRIAAALETRLGGTAGSANDDDIEVTLLNGGLTFAVDSPRLASAGAALLRRAGSMF